MSDDDFDDDFENEVFEPPFDEQDAPPAPAPARKRPGVRTNVSNMNVDQIAARDPGRAVKARTFAARLEVLLLHGHYAAAKRLADEAEAEMEHSAESLDRATLADVGVSVRTCTLLDKQFDVIHVADLRYVQTARLLATPNVGVKAIDEIWQAVLAAALKRAK
jgi:hypothetical protein